MRWAQRFGYGGVVPRFMVCVHRQASGLFSFLGEQFGTGGDLKKDITMKPVVNFKAVRKLLAKDHPPFVILHQQKLIYICKEAGEVLDISNPAWPLQQSPAKSINKRNSLPVISSNQTREQLALIQHFRSHLHLSRLLRCYLQLNKSDVASFARWALRELIPQAARQKKSQHFTRNGLQLMGLEDKERHQHIRQVLVAPGGIEAKIASRISGIDDEENKNKGGEPCRKH